MRPRLRFRFLPMLLLAALPLSAAQQQTVRPLSAAEVLRVQVLLDRAHFSPGEIDGRYGGITRGAVAAYNLAKKINAGSQVSAETWSALNADTAPVIVDYTLTAADLAGPFTKIPEEMDDKAK